MFQVDQLKNDLFDSTTTRKKATKITLENTIKIVLKKKLFIVGYTSKCCANGHALLQAMLNVAKQTDIDRQIERNIERGKHTQ